MARKFFINNRWWDSSRTKKVFNPYNNQVIDEVFLLEEEQINLVVDSNVQAFEITKQLPAHKRAEILLNIAAGINEKRDEFIDLMVKEAGKPIRFAKGEVDRAILTFTIAAEEAKRISGEVIPLDLNKASEGRFGITRRFPIGPIIGISPFNFPLNLVAHKVAPAIASGNTITIKPSSQTPLIALKLAEVLEKAGSIPGQVNVVPTSSDIAQKLALHKNFKLLSLTGSDVVGWNLRSLIKYKRTILELGGNAAVIIDQDTDIEKAAKRNLVGAFAYSGQVCISVQRIYVHENIYDEFLKIFIQKMENIGFGDPENPETIVGPLINEEAAIRVENWVNEAKEQGAEILVGGKRNGTLFEPTLIVNTKKDMKVCREEAFAPLVIIEPFSDFKEAVNMVNDSKFGLQAGVFSSNYENIFYAFKTMEVGGVIANDYPTYRIDNMPYGGVKNSGFGREGLKYAIEEMTEIKLLVFNFLQK
ncbi:MAG: aldehyde dehydrogenase family protein [Armatimonadetes bacterium]|nr:aldehyde dehydrogenase family protein [Armatimonadota bacterium]